MKRKVIAFLFILVALFSMTGCNATSPYEKLIKSSPDSIECTTTTIDSVELLGEYVLIVSEDSATRGVASFQTDNKIYLFGHQVSEQVGSFVVKVDKSNNRIDTSNLIGEVISNTENGVVAEQRRNIREYSSIPIAKTAQLGKAFMIGRDENGDICEYDITIEAFKEDQSMFLYSSSEVQFDNGLSGSPIIQNGELIGVHFAGTEDGKIGVGWIIWDLEIVLH